MSRMLAPLQFLLATALALTSNIRSIVFLICAAVGAALLIWAVITMRPSRIRIHPEIAENAELVTTGAYRWVRHPMYASLVAASIGFVVSDPQPWRVVAGVALLVVLIAKARREEAGLKERFPNYADYQNRSWAFFPGIW